MNYKYLSIPYIISLINAIIVDYLCQELNWFNYQNQTYQLDETVAILDHYETGTHAYIPLAIIELATWYPRTINVI